MSDSIDETQIVGVEGRGQNSPESVSNHITAFEKLLRHAISRFSKERLYSMLQVAIEELKAVEKNYPRSARTAGEARKPTTASSVKIKSMQQLRSAMKNLEKREEKKCSEKEKQALKYLETFENDYKYLGDLKRHFNENIHGVLLKDYFDPADRPKKDGALPRNRSDAGSTAAKGNASSRTTKGRQVNKAPQPTAEEKLTEDKHNLWITIGKLEELERKWAGLLRDRELSLDDFDPDSSHELMTFTSYTAFEPILRLVPDVFVKCYNAIDLSREWIKLAKTIYGDRLPLKTKLKEPSNMSMQSKADTNLSKEPSTVESLNPEESVKVTSEYAIQARGIKMSIKEIGHVIKENEIKLGNLNEEMRSLESRESRIDDLTNDFEQMDSKLQRANKDYNTFLLERQKTMEQINMIPRGSSPHPDLITQANTLNYELTQRQTALKILEYKKNVVQEDYLLELELRPNFIHFVGDIKQQIEDIKILIKDKQTEKQDLEKQLALLKTNTDKIKQQMQKYLERSDSSSIINEEFSQLTREIEEDIESIEGMETERTFVSVSDDVDLTEYLTAAKSSKPLNNVKDKPVSRNNSGNDQAIKYGVYNQNASRSRAVKS